MNWNEFARQALGVRPLGGAREVWQEQADELRPQWQAMRSMWEPQAPASQPKRKEEPPPWQVPTGGGAEWGAPITPRMPGGTWQGWSPQGGMRLAHGGGRMWSPQGGMRNGYDLGQVQNYRGGGGRMLHEMPQQYGRGGPIDWSGGRLRSMERPLSQPVRNAGGDKQARQAAKWRDQRAERAERKDQLQERRRSRASKRTIRGLGG